MMIRGTHIAQCLCLCALAGSAPQGLMATPSAVAEAGGDRVESPDAHWKTITTTHYRIHYPANPKGGFLPFATEVASKIEGISAKVAEFVGFETKGPTDVIIMDPLMEANGSTLPLLRKPVVTLYKTPPEPDSQLGNHENWVDLLVTHELVHLHHLMRPQNGANLFEKLFSFAGPLTMSLITQRYITEGYATLLEGRITGSGRPHSVYRAAVIRQWAIQGKLPSYDDVSGSEGYIGGSMAYLAGSAYLEWLERQFPEEPDILVTFWKQLASKKRRGFEESFKATFGALPKDSYDRWRAEVTHDAIAWEQAAKNGGGVIEGEVFGRFEGSVSDLAVSPDGTKLLAIVRAKKKPGVKIWDLTGKQEEEESKRKEKKAKEKKEKEEAPDPLEPTDRKPEYNDKRKPLATITKRNGAFPRYAWWTGNDQVTFELRLPNSEMVLKPSFRTYDLKTKRERSAPGAARPKAADGAFVRKDTDGVWNIVEKTPDGGERQITNTLSAAWQPAPTPDGKTLYYVRLTATGCEIRKLDLTAGADAQAAKATDTDADAPPQTTDTITLQAAVVTPQAPQEVMLTKGAVISLPNTKSLLPPALAEIPEAKDYSVWDTHKFDELEGITFSPAGDSYQLGIGGSDILNRLSWCAAASFGSAAGPRGGALGIRYQGWRLAPAFQAFSSLEKPSAQRFAPVLGFDRERRGAEFSLSWETSGLSGAMAKPFVAFETIEPHGQQPRLPIEPRDQGTFGAPTALFASSSDRYMAGGQAGFYTYRSKGDWGAGMFASFEGAYGRTEYADASDYGKGTDWRLLRLGAGVRLRTPAGTLRLAGEDGRLAGDFGLYDLFHLGGHVPLIVPSGLELNRVQQPALPAYTQTGDRMRVVRASYGSGLSAYFERSAVWFSDGDGPDYQRVAGLELELRLDTFDYGIISSGHIRIGVHRPFDGEMKGRTVFTVKISM